ncbi:MAG: nucleotide exchange factor GrpE [Psychromonas sp.]|nr:nucleotide exchange factor GrpE [Psychromonas sp.]
MSKKSKKSVEESIEAVKEEAGSDNIQNQSHDEVTQEEGNSAQGDNDDHPNKKKISEAILKLQTQLILAEEELKIEKENVARAQAHAQNEIRKAGLDAENKLKRTLKRFTIELLPVIDSLEIAISHIDKENEAAKSLGEGIELTLKAMVAAFLKIGIVQIDPTGQQADTNKHQIVGKQKIEGKVANEVAVVMQKGYEYNGVLIRPAMVMVAEG